METMGPVLCFVWSYVGCSVIGIAERRVASDARLEVWTNF